MHRASSVAELRIAARGFPQTGGRTCTAVFPMLQRNWGLHPCVLLFGYPTGLQCGTVDWCTVMEAAQIRCSLLTLCGCSMPDVGPEDCVELCKHARVHWGFIPRAFVFNLQCSTLMKTWVHVCLAVLGNFNKIKRKRKLFTDNLEGNNFLLQLMNRKAAGRLWTSASSFSV